MTMTNKENIDKNKIEETRAKAATADNAVGRADTKACKSACATDKHEEKK